MMAPRMKIAWGEAKRGRDHGGGVTRVSCKFVLGSMAPRSLRSDVQCLRSQPAGPSHQGPTASPRPAVQAPIPVWAWAAPPTRACVSRAAATYCRTGGVSDQEPCPRATVLSRPALTHFPSRLPSPSPE